MFHIVQWQMHTTNQKLQGIVWEICVKKYALKKNYIAFFSLRNQLNCAFVYAH